ncbi:YrrS family protein [Halalkalibacterium ligniniphilum]|uniref:YrrS family protein n=1 Tax=Halalkalibacterium ligniniphilum TaxID=1134413 RepID=UPI000345D69A|nr:DUF1510 family protein [Halalkalibacterium ligniniphilum]
MPTSRYEYKKKRRANRLLNLAIGVVGVLIVFFAAQIFFGSNTEEAATTESKPEQNDGSDTVEIARPEQEQSEQDIPSEEEEAESIEEENVQVDDWQPIGTEQTGEFSHDFNRGSTNWNEMVRAIKYATGLGDDMIIWRLENGGPTTAVGTVSAPNQQQTPFQVTIEWVENEGWMPVDVKKLQSNPYH